MGISRAIRRGCGENQQRGHQTKVTRDTLRALVHFCFNPAPTPSSAPPPPPLPRPGAGPGPSEPAPL